MHVPERLEVVAAQNMILETFGTGTDTYMNIIDGTMYISQQPDHSTICTLSPEAIHRDDFTESELEDGDHFDWLNDLTRYGALGIADVLSDRIRARLLDKGYEISEYCDLEVDDDPATTQWALPELRCSCTRNSYRDA